MKYLFIITGIAYGHFTREEAIIDKLKKLDKKAEIVIAGYETSYNYFKGKYDVLKLNPIVFPDLSSKFKILNILLKNYNFIAGWINDIAIINDFNREFKADVIVSDWEPFAIFTKTGYLIWNYKPEFSKASNFSLLIQKCAIELGYFVSRILNKKIILPSFKKEKNIKNFIYTDLIIRKKPNEVKELNKYKDSILVMIGGSRYGVGLAEKIKNVSKGFNEKFIFFGYKCKGKNCIGFDKFNKDYLSFLKSCKAVISLGGYSGISESVFYRKPNLVFPIKDHLEQYTVAEEFKDYIEIGDIDSPEEEIKIKIENFLRNLSVLKKKLNSLKLNNGADEIAEIIYRKAKS